MGDDDGLVCAYINAQDGKWQEISWEDIRKWQRGDGLLWIHLDRAADLTDFLNQRDRDYCIGMISSRW